MEYVPAETDTRLAKKIFNEEHTPRFISCRTHRFIHSISSCESLCFFGILHFNLQNCFLFCLLVSSEEAQVWWCETEETHKRKEDEDRKKTWRSQRKDFWTNVEVLPLFHNLKVQLNIHCLSSQLILWWLHSEGLTQTTGYCSERVGSRRWRLRSDAAPYVRHLPM